MCGLFGLFFQSGTDQASQAGAEKEHGSGFGNRRHVAAAAEAIAVEVGTAAAEVFLGVIVGDKIVYQGYSPCEREGSSAENLCARI